MKNYIRRQLAYGLAIDLLQGLSWLAALFAVLMLLSALCPRASAEQPAPACLPAEVQCSP